MLRKIRDKYQPYYTTYKVHAMTTCHGCTDHTGKDKDLNSHVEDVKDTDIGPDNDIESTSSFDTTIAVE